VTAIETSTKIALAVDNLSVRFRIKRGYVRAVTDVSFDLRPGELLALVGESGCGKSVLAASLLGLLPANADVAGRAQLGDVELLGAPERTLVREVRGRRIALIPQSAHAALTPTRTARSQLAETVRALESPTSVDERVSALAERVGLANEALDRYPHELSGGMAQRVVLALALAGRPQVVLADEPTSGLDRPLVERTVDTLRSLADDGIAVLMITHDLAAAERAATDVAIMYASRLVETGQMDEVFADPWHTYTRELLDALPQLGFQPIAGHPPDLTALPDDCPYALRSPAHAELCDGDLALVSIGKRRVACGMGPAC
jgi:peptide/nickel transport system ATP-binding protein